MAKRKADGGHSARENAGGPRSTMMTVRCSPDWAAWVRDLAEHDRSGNVADLIDRALVAYAREVGFARQAPKR